ncbi:PH domain-containing protein [bacterium]|jgi:hypothetical protein|nr:PH domain-containing protein [bacterium]MBT4251642.1 PH domain-containing protein [bacterium]MBT4597691.1 PH domain-containing protein [bacterium]MBT6753704.1 PH domain-containing protein [bacterium]MBT7037841.1 PH domain-containing protein [bacterium]
MNKPKGNYQHRFLDYHFKGKRDGEEIILILRRHWLILVAKLIPFGFFSIGLIAIFFLAPILTEFLPIVIDNNVFNVVMSFFFMGFWLSLFVMWIDFYYDVWIVTDQRIISIEQLGLFRREISELEHGKIQDVTTEIHGIVPTLLKFGQVYIQTAGEKARFTFKQVENPVMIRSVVMALQKNAIKQQKREEGAIMRGKV